MNFIRQPPGQMLTGQRQQARPAMPMARPQAQMQMQTQRQPGPMPMPRAAMQRPGIQRPGMALAGGMGAGMALSDEQSKARIQELETELAGVYRAMGGPAATGDVQPQAPPMQLDEAFRQPGSYSYGYKNPAAPGAGQGRFAGPMAQELQGIPGVVKETPQGKMVDPTRLTMANTSEVANQRREIDSLKRTVAALGGGSKPVDTESAPQSEAVRAALQSFGKKEPTEGQIAKKREELRATHGSKAAAEFERYAMAYRKSNRSPVKIGQATIEKPPKVEIGEAQIESGGDTKPVGAFSKLGETIADKTEGSRQFVEDKELRRGRSGELSDEEVDEIYRTFYDPPERNRTYEL